MSSGRAFHLSIPVGFESLNPVADLTDRVGRDGPLFAIRLWQHRQRTGALVAGENAAGILERLAGWTRKRGALASALVASGIVEQASKGLRIVDPFELGSVEWMGGRFNDVAVEPEVAGVAPDERARKYEAARKRVTRKKGLTDEQREAEYEALRVRFGVGRRPDASDDQADKPDMSAGQTGHDNRTDRTRTGHEPPSQDKERAYTPATGPLPVPVTETLSEEPAAAVATGPASGLFVEVEKPTPPAKPDRKPTEGQTDGEAWLAKARDAAGVTAADWPAPKGFWPRYATARKAYGRDRLLASLEGHVRSGDGWWLGKGLMALLGDSAIQAGIGSAAGPAAAGRRGAPLRVSELDPDAFDSGGPGWAPSQEAR